MSGELWRMTAREVVGLLKARKVSPLELIDAAQARIAVTDGSLNALPTLCFERARQRAKGLAGLDASHHGWLAGLPLAVKDLNEVEGVRTTWASPIFAEHISQRTDLGVQNLEARGALVIAKSNTPEFGAGAQTFNEVFGVTRNPWDTRLTCAGSSGGSAVALAAGQVWLATGSDLGGSLRTPAAFCGVVGFRPSPGRVPHGPPAPALDPFSVAGPMARNVADVALMLDAYSGQRAGDPLTFDPVEDFQAAALAAKRPARVAWSADLGICQVDRELAEIGAAAVRAFEQLGATVEEAHPDCAGAREVFQTFRAHHMASGRGPLLAEHRAKMKPEVVWNIEAGLKLSSDDLRRAFRLQGALFQRFVAFFERHDILALPTAQAPAFPVEQRYVDTINGVKLETYVDWLLITSVITMTGCPVLSLPCGFTKAGMPVGLQLVGKPRGEAALLGAAAALEQALGLSGRVPIDPLVRH